MNQAEKMVENLINGIIPVAFGSIVFLVLFYTVFGNNDSGLIKFFRILSGAISFLSCCIIGALKCNFMKLKSNLILFLKKQYRIKEFKKQL